MTSLPKQKQQSLLRRGCAKARHGVMATTGDAVSVEEVTALGVESKKAKQSVSNKKLAAALRHFITLVRCCCRLVGLSPFVAPPPVTAPAPHCSLVAPRCTPRRCAQAKEAAGSDVTTETHGDKAKQVFEFAQKVKGTNEANHRMLFTFLFRDAPSGISTTEQINAAVKFVNAAGGWSLVCLARWQTHDMCLLVGPLWLAR